MTTTILPMRGVKVTSRCGQPTIIVASGQQSPGSHGREPAGSSNDRPASRIGDNTGSMVPGMTRASEVRARVIELDAQAQVTQ